MRKLKLRPEVAAFAQLMEQKLRDNDHKGGWKDDTANTLMHRVREETTELQEAVDGLLVASMAIPDRGDIPMSTRCHAVRGEAADVANFAMMVADVSVGVVEKKRKRR